MSFNEFENKYFKATGDTNIVTKYKTKTTTTKKETSIDRRILFNERIGYTIGISTFSILLIVFMIPELKKKKFNKTNKLP